MSLIHDLNNSHLIFEKFKNKLNNRCYLYNNQINILDIYSSIITLYYIHPSLNKTSLNKKFILLKNKFRCLYQKLLINRTFKSQFDKIDFGNKNFILLLSFSIYISKDSLFDLLTPILKKTNDSIIILFDSKESSVNEIENLIKIRDNRIFIIPIQYFRQFIRNDRKINLEKIQLKKYFNEFSKLEEKEAFIFEVLKSLTDTNFIYFPVITKIFSILNISNIISSDTNDFRCKIFSEIAKFKNINILEIQYGMYGEEAIEFRYFNSSKIFVWGEWYKKIMISHGIAPDKIIVSGPLRLDYYKNKSNFETLSNKLNILYAPTHKKHPSIPKIVNQMNKFVIQLANDLPQIQFFIKPHPLDNSNDFKNLSPNVILLNNKEDIRNYIMICDIFISAGSTTTIDALILDKFVILFSLNGWENFINPFKKYKDCHLIDSYLNLHKTVENYQKRINKQVQEYIFFKETSSSNIILKYLN
jgi:hypothetical protein